MEREESNVLKVRAYLSTLKGDEFIPASPIIAKKIGLKPRDIWNALGFLREKDELAHPTTEQTQLRRSQAMLYLKDRWIHAQTYAQLFMSATEAHYALLFERSRNLPIATLNQVFSRRRLEAKQRQEALLWQEGDLRDLTKEERTDIKKRNNRYTPQGEVEQRTRVWINSFRTMEIQRLPVPNGRLEWMEIVDHVQGQKDPSNFRTHIKDLPKDELERWKMLLVDWMEDVDFHQIGLRRFTNPEYIAVMLYRQNADLQGSGIDLAAPVIRGRLQVPGASLPQRLFTTIVDIGQMTDQVLIKTGQEENDDHLGIVPIKRVLRYLGYLKFGTYYLTYLKFHPKAILAVTNPILENDIQQMFKDPQTVQAIRGWAVNLKKLMDQGRRQGLDIAQQSYNNIL